MVYYSISIIMSIGIFRHYYSVLPLTFIPFSNYIIKGKKADYLLLIIASIFGMLIIFIYYSSIKGW